MPPKSITSSHKDEDGERRDEKRGESVAPPTPGSTNSKRDKRLPKISNNAEEVFETTENKMRPSQRSKSKSFGAGSAQQEDVSDGTATRENTPPPDGQRASNSSHSTRSNTPAADSGPRTSAGEPSDPGHRRQGGQLLDRRNTTDQAGFASATKSFIQKMRGKADISGPPPQAQRSDRKAAEEYTLGGNEPPESQSKRPDVLRKSSKISVVGHDRNPSRNSGGYQRGIAEPARTTQTSKVPAVEQDIGPGDRIQMLGPTVNPLTPKETSGGQEVETPVAAPAKQESGDSYFPPLGKEGHSQSQSQTQSQDPQSVPVDGVDWDLSSALYAMDHDLAQLVTAFQFWPYGDNFRVILGWEGKNYPEEINRVRDTAITLIGCYDGMLEDQEKALEDLIEEQERSERENLRHNGKLDAELKQSNAEEEELERECKLTSDRQEQEIQSLKNSLAQKTEKPDHASQTLDDQAKQLANLSTTNDAQYQLITQLKEELKDKSTDEIPAQQLRDAQTIERQKKKIHSLQEDIERQKKKIYSLQEEHVTHALATGTNTTEWKQVYWRMKNMNKSQEEEINRLKNSIKDLFTDRPALEREVKKLREDATLQRDALQSLQSQLQLSQDKQAAWKEECEQKNNMLEQRGAGEAEALKEMHIEIQATIEQYHALMPTKDNPDALQVTGLLHQVAAQEKTLKEMALHLEELKKDKAKLETEVQKGMDEKEDLIKENEDLRHGPKTEPQLQREFLNPDTHEKFHLPKWDYADIAAKRKAAVDELRKELEEERKKKEAEEELMEKVRRWKMGRWYPPLRNNFRELQKTRGWERWKGRRWVDEKGTAEDYDEAFRLGLMKGPWKKETGVRDFKGKRVSSMGLKHWDPDAIG